MSRSIAVGLTFALLVAGCASTPQPDETGLSGLVVVEADPEGVAARAGIEVGDVLLEWSRAEGSDAPRSGVFGSPFDLEQVMGEESPRGLTRIEGRHGDGGLSSVLVEGDWGLEVRPRLGGPQDRVLAAALAEVDAGRAAAVRGLALEEKRPAVRAWLLMEAAEAAGAEERGELWGAAIEAAAEDRTALAWVHERQARALEAARLSDEAKTGYADALDCRSENNLVRARSLHLLGTLDYYRGDLDSAEGSFHDSLEIKERLAPGSLDLAKTLNNLGLVAADRGDLDAAEGFQARALEIKERLVPGSLDLAGTLTNLGGVAARRRDLDAAESFLRRAVDIQERLEPDSSDLAASLIPLALVASHRGDLNAGEGYLRRSLRIFERLQPGSMAVARTLNNLGIVAERRGNLDAAERYHHASLEIKERLAPGTLDVASSFNNLGNLARARGDLNGAEGYYLRALEIKERVAPGSLDVARTLNNLGLVAVRRGDLGAAEAHNRRALEIKQRIAPDSLEEASALTSLGIVAADSGDLAQAEAYHLRALEINERDVPDSLTEARNVNNLAVVAFRSGDLDAAESYLARGLAIFDRKAPETTGHASTLNLLGKTVRAAGRSGDALTYLLAALDSLEAQQTRLGGGSEARGEFRSEYIDFYRDAVDLLVEVGRADDGVNVLERSRAQGMLALLAERDIVFSIDVPAEQERERRIARADYQRLLDRLARLDVDEGEGRLALEDELQAARLRQDEIAARIRAASPKLADLQYPVPLDSSAVRAVLEPGAVAIYWSLGDTRGVVAAVTSDEVRAEVTDLTLGRAQGLTRAMRRRCSESGLDRTDNPAAEELSHGLLAPVRGLVESAERLVLVPDGPLWLLPFGALPMPGGGGLLAERTPLSLVASVTVLDQLKRDSRSAGALRIEAFGDPVYPNAGSGAAATRGLDLAPLPATRAEVEAVSSLFGESVHAYLGPRATEETVMALDRETTILHLAAHGLVDERVPLDSAVALTINEGWDPLDPEADDNGLLQAWEVFESLRIDADLVVLSACDTALGKDVAGEGIVGISRAFQYAGARAVLASLWSVADQSTAELMTRFYAGLKAGLPKDEALQRAQLAFVKGPVAVSRGEGAPERDLSHPFYWAAFQLYGDWR